MKVALTTLGCKVNRYETEAMRELFQSAGWTVVDFAERADAYVINTCTVTQVSDAKSRQLIARAHRSNPEALIAAVGCYAQTAPETVSALEGVGLVLGTDGKARIVEAVTKALSASGEKSAICMPPPGQEGFMPLSAVRDSRTRATLKIQDGCVNYCAYCIIPYARGPLRSRPLPEISREVTALAREGYREVVLTGIHLASYGRDLGDCGLLDAIERASGAPGLERIRLGSLEPLWIDRAVAKALAQNPKVCRQFHLSLQSGSDAVLTRMNRRYSAATYLGALELLREEMPSCAITTDVIAGFPGETEAEHQETLAFCERAGFARMHVFPFSERAGTKAASMPGRLEKSVREARARELSALGKRLTRSYLAAQIGSVVEVLAEDGGEGYSGNYIRVRTNAPEGSIVRVQLTALRGEIAYGKEIDEHERLHLL